MHPLRPNADAPGSRESSWAQARFNGMKTRATAILRQLSPGLSDVERERLAVRMAVIELKYAGASPVDVVPAVATGGSLAAADARVPLGR